MYLIKYVVILLDWFEYSLLILEPLVSWGELEISTFLDLIEGVVEIEILGSLHAFSFGTEGMFLAASLNLKMLIQFLKKILLKVPNALEILMNTQGTPTK